MVSAPAIFAPTMACGTAIRAAPTTTNPAEAVRRATAVRPPPMRTSRVSGGDEITVPPYRDQSAVPRDVPLTSHFAGGRGGEGVGRVRRSSGPHGLAGRRLRV